MTDSMQITHLKSSPLPRLALIGRRGGNGGGGDRASTNVDKYEKIVVVSVTILERCTQSLD